MEAQTYYESLVAQGYSAEQAQQYTAQHYPGFGAEPTPASAPAVADSVVSGNVHMGDVHHHHGATAAAPSQPQPQMMTGAVGVAVQPQIPSDDSNTTSKGMRITNGIFGILMSLVLIGYSLLIIGMWEEIGDDLEEEMILLGFLAETDDDVADFHDGLDSFLSTISLLYMAILAVSVIVLIISIMQFKNKPWGTKALLGSTGFLLVLLVATAAYEVSSINQILDDMDEITGDDSSEDKLSITEVNGMIGAYCAGLCFIVYAILAFIGKPKGEPVTMQANQMI